MGFRIIRSIEKRPPLELALLREREIAEIAEKWNPSISAQGHIPGAREFIKKLEEISAQMDAQSAWDTLEKIKYEWRKNSEGARALQVNVSSSKLIELL